MDLHTWKPMNSNIVLFLCLHNIMFLALGFKLQFLFLAVMSVLGALISKTSYILSWHATHLKLRSQQSSLFSTPQNSLEMKNVDTTWKLE